MTRIYKELKLKPCCERRAQAFHIEAYSIDDKEIHIQIEREEYTPLEISHCPFCGVKLEIAS